MVVSTTVFLECRNGLEAVGGGGRVDVAFPISKCACQVDLWVSVFAQCHPYTQS